MNIWTIVATLIIFGVLITTHELGHFIAAKKCGVIVEEFAIGMGPLIFSYQDEEKRSTKYSLRLLPIGGYCKMYGEDASEMGDGSLNSISPLKKIIILAAGSVMNLLTAILTFIILFSIMGTHPSNTISSVVENSPAAIAGIESGDTIYNIEGSEIDSWEGISENIAVSDGSSLMVGVIKEDGSKVTYKITPEFSDENNSYMIGISPEYTGSIFSVITKSFESFFMFIGLTFTTVIDLFTGGVGIDELSGPIGVATVINDFISGGILVLFNITAMLSISIGIFNLLPIPALDGSRILFAIVEIIKGSPIDPEKEGKIHFIGFVFLMGLALLVAYNDVLRIF